MFVSHLFAILWIFVGKIDQQNQSTWIQNAQIQDKQWYIQYLHSYYFVVVIMITVGFGDINPTNNIEIILCIITMLIACGVFAYVQQVKEYLQYFWKEYDLENKNLEKEVIDQLSLSLKKQLLLDANKIILKHSQIFQNFSDILISLTIPLIQEENYPPGVQIMDSESNTKNSIYFIQKGNINVFSSYDKDCNNKLMTLNSGNKQNSNAYIDKETEMNQDKIDQDFFNEVQSQTSIEYLPQNKNKLLK
ncbi:Cyclic nucleotide-binding protein [Pseudocohnilembus persalinus]|uniref:Cyclic nucleotide-binding protein n=1 Tax=Pseudocohnilembus persalinus TaxID=266149 RepID=A0A0V0QQS8_PSEPJ|nr:Cyclic nucleotide-binding protein [Pseudocohnilembus persalinus]|eukprot:KRX04525.1 Cyclic nucleotide-binding protein [Pseudocohnilembus persalinus]